MGVRGSRTQENSELVPAKAWTGALERAGPDPGEGNVVEDPCATLARLGALCSLRVPGHVLQHGVLGAFRNTSTVRARFFLRISGPQ